MNGQNTSNLRPTTITIVPHDGWRKPNFKEIWDYRDLLIMWSARTIAARFKQSILGPFSMLISPVFTVILFTFVFGNLAKMPSEGIPYPIYSFTAIIPWTFFVQGMSQAAVSILSTGSIMKKVYFPRIIMPLSAVIVGVLDLMISLLALFIMLFIFIYLTPSNSILHLPLEGFFEFPATSSQIDISWHIIFLPVFILVALVTSLGFGIWFGALNAQFRDAAKILDIMTRFWVYVTPVAYPSEVFEGPTRLLLLINPMTFVVEGFRWAVLGTAPPGPEQFASVTLAIVILISGMLYFRRVEDTLVDVM